MARVWLQYGYTLPSPCLHLGNSLPKGNRKCQPKTVVSNMPFLCKRYAFSLSATSRFSQEGITHRLNHSISIVSKTHPWPPFSASKQAVLHQNALQLTNKCWFFGTHSCAFGRGRASEIGAFVGVLRLFRGKNRDFMSNFESWHYWS